MPSLELPRFLKSESLEQLGSRALGDQFFDRRPSWVGGQISELDSIFLAGLACHAGARKIVEIGVASGWSSAVLLQATASGRSGAEVYGIDLAPKFYLNGEIDTGQAVKEVVPELASQYRLLTGALAFERMAEIGAIDFAFIDGHHYHPWAMLDLLSLLPFIERGRWVALHDLNLCTFERHKHTNRGPYYLFYLWPDQKLHSTQVPAMIGAINIDRKPSDYLPLILEMLYTPWELSIDRAILERFEIFIGEYFGSQWRDRFAQLFEANVNNRKTS